MSSISKTDYILWRACAKNAWLRIHKPDVYYATELTEYEQSVMEMGIEVERVARGLFPDGAIVTGSQTNALQETRSLIASNTPTLFQPVFEREECLAVVDVLRCESAAFPTNLIVTFANRYLLYLIVMFAESATALILPYSVGEVRGVGAVPIAKSPAPQRSPKNTYASPSLASLGRQARPSRPGMWSCNSLAQVRVAGYWEAGEWISSSSRSDSLRRGTLS